MTTIAQNAIARSISQNEIVTIDYDAEAIEELSAECEDSTDADGLTEFWGTDDGEEWRVHVRDEIPKRDLRAFSIDDGEGNELAAGLSEYEVERVAQTKADELGEPVWYYRSPAREDEESIQVDPSC